MLIAILILCALSLSARMLPLAARCFFAWLAFRYRQRPSYTRISAFCRSAVTIVACAHFWLADVLTAAHALAIDILAIASYRIKLHRGNSLLTQRTLFFICFEPDDEMMAAYSVPMALNSHPGDSVSGDHYAYDGQSRAEAAPARRASSSTIP